jgi:hypothetical protein
MTTTRLNHTNLLDRLNDLKAVELNALNSLRSANRSYRSLPEAVDEYTRQLVERAVADKRKAWERARKATLAEARRLKRACNSPIVGVNSVVRVSYVDQACKDRPTRNEWRPDAARFDKAMTKWLNSAQFDDCMRFAGYTDAMRNVYAVKLFLAENCIDKPLDNATLDSRLEELRPACVVIANHFRRLLARNNKTFTARVRKLLADGHKNNSMTRPQATGLARAARTDDKELERILKTTDADAELGVYSLEQLYQLELKDAKN